MSAENKDKAIALAKSLGLEAAAKPFVARDGSERWNVWLWAKVDPTISELDQPWARGVPFAFTSFSKFSRYARQFTAEFMPAGLAV